MAIIDTVERAVSVEIASDIRTFGRLFVLGFGNCFVFTARKHIWNLQCEFTREFLYNSCPFAAPSKCRPVRSASPHYSGSGSG